MNAPRGGGLLIRTQQLPFTPKKYQAFQAQKNYILAAQKIPPFCNLFLRKEPKMHKNDP